MSQNIDQESDMPEWESLEKEIKKSKEIYRWQIRVDSVRSDKFGRYFQNGMAISMIILALFFGWLAVRGDNWTGFWVIAGAGILMTCFVRFLWMADNLYHYKLTDKGILYTQRQVIPDVTYSIL
ncbi:hypothetical protein [Vibrio aerogenes]|uniref:hypothetical protein n=1 Tax=Vibrio aerogenes TaxID=92172 RepID=UPI0021C3F72E|nr:hypothetical protein [Vibrio aerogenes]